MVKEVLRTTQEGELSIGIQLGKRKKEQELTLPTITKKIDGTTPNRRGSQRSLYPRIKCEWCRQRGHKHKNAMLEVDLCHRCHKPGDNKADCTQ